MIMRKLFFFLLAGLIANERGPARARLDRAQPVSRPLLLGGLFGFFTYATYDLTNMATIRGWPLTMVVVDVLWGTLLCTLVATVSFYVGRWLMS